MAVSATAFGSAPTFAKLAFDNFITPSSLQSYRFLITFVVIIFVTIIVKQIGSPIRRPEKQRQTLIGLGLNKMHKTRELEDTPSVRGMVNKIPHLVKIIEERG